MSVGEKIQVSFRIGLNHEKVGDFLCSKKTFGLHRDALEQLQEWDMDEYDHVGKASVETLEKIKEIIEARDLAMPGFKMVIMVSKKKGYGTPMFEIAQDDPLLHPAVEEESERLRIEMVCLRSKIKQHLSQFKGVVSEKYVSLLAEND